MNDLQAQLMIMSTHPPTPPPTLPPEEFNDGDRYIYLKPSEDFWVQWEWHCDFLCSFWNPGNSQLYLWRNLNGTIYDQIKMI